MAELRVVDGIAFLDKTLVPIWEKVQADERLSFDEGVHLLKTTDIAALGRMADHVKTRKSGDKVDTWTDAPDNTAKKHSAVCGIAAGCRTVHCAARRSTGALGGKRAHEFSQQTVPKKEPFFDQDQR